MLAKAVLSWFRLMVALAAWSWMRPVCWGSIEEGDSTRLPGGVVRAVIWSRTSRWLARAWATMTAVRRAATVVVVARSTPLISSWLFLRTRSRAREPWTASASWGTRSLVFWWSVYVNC